MKNILVTGGCGFIGSNFIRHLFQKKKVTGRIINADKLTYAGNPENLADISKKYSGEKYIFEPVDIVNFAAVQSLFTQYQIDTVVHFAAESHVDRSIHGPQEFIQTNIVGTFNLLESARLAWTDKTDKLFHHVSTDEVFGSLGQEGLFQETTPYDPHSPYAASKASSDHLVKSYFHTFHLPVKISNCSNNYGPYQFPEKLIPLMIVNALEGKKLPIYGAGKNIRDWLYVEDHCEAIWTIMNRGNLGETYNIGGESEMENIEIVREICQILEELRPAHENPHLQALIPEEFAACQGHPTCYKALITYVPDRPGHDQRYGMNITKIKTQLNWHPQTSLSEGLRKTIQWYLNHHSWLTHIRTGSYRHWIDQHYGNTLK